MRKFKVVVLLVMLLGLASATPSQSASCYSPAEFEAEQGLRIHSELMVIGLTCLKMPGGKGLYSKYQTFTQRNQHLISNYENALIDYFRRNGAPNAEGQFHTLRTGLANQISKHAIGNVVGFCQAFAPRLDQALAMDQAKLRRWAQQTWPQSPTSRPACRGFLL